MSTIQISYIQTDDNEFVTVWVPGHDPLPASADHPNFDAIRAAVTASPADRPSADEFIALFDIQQAVSDKFQRLSERVSVRNGHVFLDGDPMDEAVTTQILRFLDEGVDDWQPLVSYMENIQANPSENSRRQLFAWLRNHDITITEHGTILTYKGVESDGNGGYRSTSSGRAIVDGQPVTGKIPNYVGATVEMPRSEVVDDPNAYCHSGLHTGTFDYATGYGRRGAMLLVEVNPRDVVSVPNDARGEKVRCCRYVVREIIETPLTTAYQSVSIPVDDGDFDEDDDYAHCLDCDEYVDECVCDDELEDDYLVLD